MGESRSITKSATFYQISKQQFFPLGCLQLLHNSPSGCMHNNQAYIYSRAGVEVYNQDSDTWAAVAGPARLRCLPFQYSISVSPQLILILGGKQNNRASMDAQLWNTETGQLDHFVDALPLGVTRDRSWGPVVINGFVHFMANLQAAVQPQVAIKKGGVLLMLVGSGGCWMNVLVAGEPELLADKSQSSVADRA